MSRSEITSLFIKHTITYWGQDSARGQEARSIGQLVRVLGHLYAYQCWNLFSSTICVGNGSRHIQPPRGKQNHYFLQLICCIQDDSEP